MLYVLTGPPAAEGFQSQVLDSRMIPSSVPHVGNRKVDGAITTWLRDDKQCPRDERINWTKTQNMYNQR